MRGWTATDENLELELIERISRAGSRLDYLISDLLDFTRLERGQLKITLTPLNVADVVHDVVQRAGATLDQHRVDIGIEDTLVVAGDPTALARVLENLLSNAASSRLPTCRSRFGQPVTPTTWRSPCATKAVASPPRSSI